MYKSGVDYRFGDGALYTEHEVDVHIQGGGAPARKEMANAGGWCTDEENDGGGALCTRHEADVQIRDGCALQQRAVEFLAKLAVFWSVLAKMALFLPHLQKWRPGPHGHHADVY